MPSETRQLQLVLDLKDRASKQLQGFRGQMEKMRPAFQRMAIGGAAAFAGVAAGIGKSVEAARRAEDIESLFSLAFDETEDRARKFVNEFADQFGRAESTVKDSVARVAFNLQKVGGISEDEMFKMSTGVQKAAEGLSLLDVNIDTAADVSQAFADALAGTNQNLGRMIGGLREEDIERRAVTEGIIEEGEEMDRTQRARALYLEFMESTPAAQAKMEEQNRGLTDTYIQFQATLTEVQEVLGNQFLPILNDVLQRVKPIIQGIGDWIEANPELARNIGIAVAALAGFVGLVGGLGLLLLAISGPALIVAAAFGAIGAVALLVAKHWDTVKEMTKALVETFQSIFKPILDSIKGALRELWSEISEELLPALKEWWRVTSPVLIPVLKFLAGLLAGALLIGFRLIIEVVTKLVQFFTKLLEWSTKLTEFFRGAFAEAWDFIRDKISGVVDIVQDVIDKFQSAINLASRLINKAGDIGGSVLGSIGSVLGVNDAIITPQGKVIQTNPADYLIATKRPQDLGGGGGITINITGTFGSDAAEEIGDQIIKRLQMSNKFT